MNHMTTSDVEAVATIAHQADRLSYLPGSFFGGDKLRGGVDVDELPAVGGQLESASWAVSRLRHSFC
jgi:hypothetical protein